MEKGYQLYIVFPIDKLYHYYRYLALAFSPKEKE